LERQWSTGANEIWASDLVADSSFAGKCFCALATVDACTRERSAIEGDKSLTGDAVVGVMKRVTCQRGKAPTKMHVDSGPEYISRTLDHWAYQHKVTRDFSRPGKPTDNAFVESLNGRLRDKRLNTHWFLSLADARAKTEAWRGECNECRPYTSRAPNAGGIWFIGRR
jgi:putative transposase